MMMMMMMMIITIIIIIIINSNVILWESTISSHFTETPQCFVTQICCSPQIVFFIPRTVTQPFKTGMHKLSKNVQATTKFSVLEEWHWNKFRTEDIQILGATVQNLVARTNWCRGMVRPYTSTEFTVTKKNGVLILWSPMFCVPASYTVRSS